MPKTYGNAMSGGPLNQSTAWTAASLPTKPDAPRYEDTGDDDEEQGE